MKFKAIKQEESVDSSTAEVVELIEVNDVVELVSQAAKEDANIIFGFISDDSMEGIKVVILASGYEGMRKQKEIIEII